MSSPRKTHKDEKDTKAQKDEKAQKDKKAEEDMTRKRKGLRECLAYTVKETTRPNSLPHMEAAVALCCRVVQTKSRPWD